MSEKGASTGIFVSAAMLAAGKSVFLGLVDQVTPEVLVDQIFRAMRAAEEQPEIADTYARIYGPS